MSADSLPLWCECLDALYAAISERSIPVPVAVSEVLKQNFHSGEGALAGLAVELLPFMGLPGDASWSVASLHCMK